MKAPLALEGAKLAGGVVIRKAKLRGVESSGMLCSARELGLSEEHEGILELPDELVTGHAACARRSTLDDTILTLNVTPNRGDVLSVLGVAREVAAITATQADAAGARAGRGRDAREIPRAPRGAGRAARGSPGA